MKIVRTTFDHGIGLMTFQLDVKASALIGAAKNNEPA